MGFQEMHWKTAVTVMIISSQLNAAELEIPKVFVNGEVADADDFNLNNDYLVDKLKRRKLELMSYCLTPDGRMLMKKDLFLKK